jgi:hypothetical protein
VSARYSRRILGSAVSLHLVSVVFIGTVELFSNFVFNRYFVYHLGSAFEYFVSSHIHHLCRRLVVFELVPRLPLFSGFVFVTPFYAAIGACSSVWPSCRIY